jgi:hypothetical protein
MMRLVQALTACILAISLVETVAQGLGGRAVAVRDGQLLPQGDYMITMNASENCGAAAEQYIGVNTAKCQDTRSLAEYTVLQPLTVQGIGCSQGDVSCTLDFTLYKNTSATAIACTSTNESGCSDYNDPTAYAAGDTMTLGADDVASCNETNEECRVMISRP